MPTFVVDHHPFEIFRNTINILPFEHPGLRTISHHEFAEGAGCVVNQGHDCITGIYSHVAVEVQDVQMHSLDNPEQFELHSFYDIHIFLDMITLLNGNVSMTRDMRIFKIRRSATCVFNIFTMILSCLT